MKILFIAEIKHYRDWIGKTYRDILITIMNMSGHDIEIKYFGNYSIIELNSIYDLIIIFTTDPNQIFRNFTNIVSLNIPIYLSALDMFYFSRVDPNIMNSIKGIIHFSYANKVMLTHTILF